MEQWKEYKLGDICKTNISQYSAKENWDNALYLDTGNITDNKINEIVTINDMTHGLPSRARRKVKDKDILFSTVRPNQRHIGILQNPQPNLLVSTGFTVISANQDVADPYFLYYFLSQKEIVDYLHAIAEQAVSAYPSIKASDIEDLDILLPNFSQQKKISKLLKSLDDKIELNRQINDNLEQQAQALFNHYFVENTELLGEYDEVSLLDIASYTNGLAMQKYRPSEDETSYLPVMKIKELGQGFTDSNSDICTCNIPEIYIINSGDIIFSWSGTLMVKIWCGETAGLNQHLFKVYSESYEKWFYYFWTKYHLRKFINIAKDKAVTMGHIKREDLAKSKVLLPNKATLQNLNKIFSPIMDSIINNEIESKRQVQLRDTLLPRLMSGELKINEINC